MARPKIFFSFHFDNDAMRVQQVRNIGAIEGNPLLAPNDWEAVKRRGDAAVQKWIDDNMKDKDCVVVLVGKETASRPWVNYEIRKAWDSGKGLMGIYIDDLKCPRSGVCARGPNPFEKVSLKNGRKLSEYVTCYSPSSNDAYNDIAKNIESWIEKSIRDRK